jgi:mannose-6-phosphate isomerase-like protein (cupin superfamily)
MPARPRITLAPGHFTSKVEVLAEIARDDLWPVTVHQDGFPPAPLHYHEADVRIYVLSGALLVNGGTAQPELVAGFGMRVEIPAGALHTVSTSGAVVTITAFTSSAATAGLPQLPAPENS